MPWFYNLEDTESLIYGVEAWDDLFRLCAALVPPPSKKRGSATNALD
jgi:hypothetical protein